MSAKSFKEWANLYTKKTGDEVELPEGFKLVYLSDRGFCVYKHDEEGKMIIAYEVCGDGRFWRDYCEIIACECNAECIASVCTRPVLPYIKAFGWEILKDEVNDEGNHRYHCQDNIGRLVLLTYKGDNNGVPHYFVTHYLNRKYSEGSGI